MKRIGVLYATRDGHTVLIAEHVAVRLQGLGASPEVRNLGDRSAAINLSRYDAVVLAAPFRAGKHLPEMVKFIKESRAQLDKMPTAFLSVSLSQAGAERPGASPQERAPFVADVQRVIREFLAETGWRPTRLLPVAGALLYRKYNFFLRFMLQRIARKANASTDTSRNHEYTDWAALDRFTANFLKEIAGPHLVIVRTKSA